MAATQDSVLVCGMHVGMGERERERERDGIILQERNKHSGKDFNGDISITFSVFLSLILCVSRCWGNELAVAV